MKASITLQVLPLSQGIDRIAVIDQVIAYLQSQEIFSDTINPTWYQMMIKEVTQLFAPML